jgi:flagellar motor switch protein FliN
MSNEITTSARVTATQETLFYGDVPLSMGVELDVRYLTVREILSLETGSVIRMNRSAGENIDIYAGDTLIGYGEIVLIESTLGVRITDFRGED